MKWMCTLTVILALAAPLAAQEDKERAELLALLEEETDVATKTRMNSDYVPGIVTVLDGDDLRALGIANAGEALGLVPGMQAIRSARGDAAVIVRGLDFPFNNGNIAILINSVPLSRQDSGISASALLIPVEQIERIEVIRGPGSVIYGDFAFMGLVNIITRKEGSQVYGRIEAPRRTNEVGARTGLKSGPSSFAASLSRWWSDDAPATITVRDARDRRWFGAGSYERGGFSLAAQTAQRTFQSTNPGLAFDEESWAADARYTRTLAPKLRTEARLTYLHNDVAAVNDTFSGNVTKIGVNAVWDGWRRQSWLAEADYSVSTIDDAAHRPPPAPGQPPPNLAPLAHDVDRTITGLTLQDRIELRNNVALTLGARYDTYSDLDSRLTPRVSLVWRATDRHILKAQYAEGFRPPTFFELYAPPIPNARYPFEVNATTEVNYVYRRTASVGRLTVFRSIMSNMIRPGGFVTDPNARADGVEGEWSQQLSPSLKIDANASYVDTVDPRRPGAGAPRLPNPVSAAWLGNLSLLYRPGWGVVVGSRWSHVGKRDAGDGFDLVDLTVSRPDVFVHGLDVRAGVKNAFDADVTYLTALPNGNVATNHFPGRSLFVEIGWRR